MEEYILGVWSVEMRVHHDLALVHKHDKFPISVEGARIVFLNWYESRVYHD